MYRQRVPQADRFSKMLSTAGAASGRRHVSIPARSTSGLSRDRSRRSALLKSEPYGVLKTRSPGPAAGGMQQQNPATRQQAESWDAQKEHTPSTPTPSRRGERPLRA